MMVNALLSGTGRQTLIALFFAHYNTNTGEKKVVGIFHRSTAAQWRISYDF